MSPWSLLPATRRGAAVLALTLAFMSGCGGGGGSSSTTETTAPPARAAAGGGLEQQFISVVRGVSPDVVQIQTGGGLGSGVVYDDGGNIVTNAHVVGNAKSFEVTLSAGSPRKATLVGSYPPDDLAVIRVEGKAPAPARFADSSKLQVGQIVLAIGNPLGLRSSVTEGIISSLERTVSEGNGAVISSAVQTSAAINPGNSGGALVALDHEVVGIPTLAALNPELGGSAAPGIGFAIPSNTVRRIADQLIADGKVTRSGRAYLGVSVAPNVTGEGVVVASVEKGGPAAKAGMQRGDVIVKVAGQPTPSGDELLTVLATLKPGAEVPVEIVRDGKPMTLKVTLAERPA